jgi:DNA-binding XRE family transcriptional regulator
MTPGERLGAYCKARKIYESDVVRSLRFQKATSNGFVFGLERWKALVSGGAPILQEEAPFIAAMLGVTLTQLALILTGENAQPFLADPNAGDFGSALRHARTRADMTQVQLANKSGIAQAYISVLERKKKPPGFEILSKLACGLGVSWEKLLPAFAVEAYRTRYSVVDEEQALLDELADVL